MQTDKFEQVVNRTPVIKAVFRIKKVPEWMTTDRWGEPYDIKKGDLFYYDHATTVRHIRTGLGFIVYPSHYSFVGYKCINKKSK